jgi:hypothetical protein
MSLEQIEQEIEALESQLLQLKARRNMFTPLARLPAEILGRILYFAQVPSRANEDDDRYLKSPLVILIYDRRWTEYTLVCKRIRSVALETPILWTFVELDFSRPPTAWTEICVKRAKECPLEIYAPVEYVLNGPGAPSQLLVKYLGRARSLISSMTRKIRKSLRTWHIAALTTPMPLLEEMYCDMPEINLNADFMGGSCSSLLKLYLGAVTFSHYESTPDFSALRILVFAMSSETHEIRQFITLFNHTPRLEALSVDTSLGDITINANDVLAPVSLPHLHTFHLVTSFDVIPAFTSIIPIPHDKLGIELNDVPFRLPVPELYTYMSRFWSNVAGNRPFPSGIAQWICDDECHITIGSAFTLEPDDASLGPCLFLYFSAHPAITPGIAPQLLELVDIIYVEGPNRHRSSGEALHALVDSPVRYLVVRNGEQMSDLPWGLANWVRERARAGRPLETATFMACKHHESEESLWAYAEMLRRNNLVRHVVWEGLPGRQSTASPSRYESERW